MGRATTTTTTATAGAGAGSGAGAGVAATVAVVAAIPLALMGLVVLFAFGFATPPAAGCGAGGPVAASTDLSPATVAGIEALRPLYQEAAGPVGIPWPLLAAVDYRESGNDPVRSALSGEPLGTPNPDNPSLTTTDKADSLARAAQHLVAMGRSVYGVELGPASTDTEVQLALLAYNRGSIYRSAGLGPEVSPYVMNQLDGAHLDMAWPDVAGEPLAGLRELSRYGAWTVFVRLGGAATPGCGPASDVAVVAIAQAQLGLGEDPPGSNRGPAIAKFQGSAALVGEAWCADFASWVYARADTPFTGGLDGGWRLSAVAGVQAWFQANGIWVDRGQASFAAALAPLPQPRAVPQPGDAIVFAAAGQDHMGLVESVDGDVVQTIEGNSSDAVARRRYPSYATNPEIVGWGRMQ
ncbi:MAG TPA: CHAP domain-containing protein [Acidimicrobiales bacterium]|nr:CHAP domain-containing protein [Acidimicrobiales bacterium]